MTSRSNQVTCAIPVDRAGTSGLCTGHIGFWSREYCAATKAPAERNPSDGHDACRSGAVRRECRRLEACRFRSRWAQGRGNVHRPGASDQEETTLVEITKDGHTVGELFVDETVGYDENTDAFVIRTAQ